jgi:hypothetical protein
MYFLLLCGIMALKKKRNVIKTGFLASIEEKKTVLDDFHLN